MDERIFLATLKLLSEHNGHRMSYSMQRFYENYLDPIALDETSLKRVLKELHSGILTSVVNLLKHAREDKERETLYVGSSGGLVTIRSQMKKWLRQVDKALLSCSCASLRNTKLQVYKGAKASKTASANECLGLSKAC